MREATPAGNDPPAPAIDTWIARAAVLVALALTTILCIFPELDFDIWWHLRTGRLILEEGRIPFTDPFSFTAAGRPWVTHEWGAEALFHTIDRLGGIDALILFKALIATTALALSAWAGAVSSRASAGGTAATRMRRSTLPGAALGLLLAAPLIAPRAFVRPHMLTAFLLGATLLILQKERETGLWRWRIILIPLFVLWANLHSGFVLGLATVALSWIGAAIERPTPSGPTLRARVPGFALLAAACLVNPHTWKAFAYPFALIGRPEVRSGIVELRTIFHPAYAGALFLPALLAAGLILAALLLAQRRTIRWSILLPGLFFAVLALMTLRGVSEFAVLVPALVAAHGRVLAPRSSGSLLGRAARRSLPILIALLTFAGGILAATRGVPMGAEASRRVGLGVDRANLPDAAVRFLRDAAPPGRVFHILAFGGYFIHELWPDRQTYIDGRLDVFPEGFLDAYREMMQTGHGWEDAVREHDLAFAVVDYLDDPSLDTGLRAHLRDDPEWVLVCFSDNLLVYARRIPANAELIRLFGSPFDPGLRSFDSLQAWMGSVPVDQVRQAAASIERMLPYTANAATPTRILAMILVHLAEIERASGAPERAAAHLQRAVQLDATNFLARLRLGISCAQSGDLEDARRHFEAAGRLRPNDPSLRRNVEILNAIERSRGTAIEPAR